MDHLFFEKIDPLNDQSVLSISSNHVTKISSLSLLERRGNLLCFEEVGMEGYSVAQDTRNNIDRAIILVIIKIDKRPNP